MSEVRDLMSREKGILVDTIDKLYPLNQPPLRRHETFRWRRAHGSAQRAGLIGELAEDLSRWGSRVEGPKRQSDFVLRERQSSQQPEATKLDQ
jgi:hypothetical protein